MNSDNNGLPATSFFSPPALVLGLIIVTKYFLSKEFFAAFVLLLGLPAIIVALLKERHHFLKWTWPLVGVFILGCFGAGGHEARDVLRDSVFALSSVALFALGYWMAENKPTAWLLVLKVIVLGGVAVASVHLSDFIIHPEILRLSVNELRELVSFKTVGLVILALTLVIFTKKLSGIELFPSIIRRFVFMPVLILSAVLSFSRTGILVGLALGICLLGWLSRVHLRSMMTLVLVLAGGWAFLVTTPKDEADTFRSKLAQSFKEVAAESYSDEKDINENWRGFETKLVLDDYLDQGLLKKGIGKGFGALVDLGFYINLGGEEMRHIPIFHNGYVYILIKTGILGLLCYLIFYFKLIKRAVYYSRFLNPEDSFLGRLLLGATLNLIVTMFVVGGMAEMHGSEFVLLLGCLIRTLEQFSDEANGESDAIEAAHG